MSDQNPNKKPRKRRFNARISFVKVPGRETRDGQAWVFRWKEPAVCQGRVHYGKPVLHQKRKTEHFIHSSSAWEWAKIKATDLKKKYGIEYSFGA